MRGNKLKQNTFVFCLRHFPLRLCFYTVVIVTISHKHFLPSSHIKKEQVNIIYPNTLKRLSFKHVINLRNIKV